jgi:protein gp37
VAENSAIEWTDHTFNPWIGCTKVGPGCDHCYAETLSRARLGVVWGPGQERRRTKPANWAKPRKWNREAAAFAQDNGGRKQRVFCASLADVFDNEVDPAWRRDLFDLIAETPNLDWLLVTKRIGNVAKMLAEIGIVHLPPHVWLGITVVNQAEADRDVPKLLAAPATIRFLSIEPMQGPVDLRWIAEPDEEKDGVIDALLGCNWIDGMGFGEPFNPMRPGHEDRTMTRRVCSPEADILANRKLDWVIVGGESGSGARPMHPDWARSLRDQCEDAGVPFLFKQWGEWAPIDALRLNGGGWATVGPIGRRGNVRDWMDRYVTFQEDAGAIRVRGHSFTGHATDLAYCVGKKAAGRLLDGVEHNGYPEAANG